MLITLCMYMGITGLSLWYADSSLIVQMNGMVCRVQAIGGQNCMKVAMEKLETGACWKTFSWIADLVSYKWRLCGLC